MSIVIIIIIINCSASRHSSIRSMHAHPVHTSQLRLVSEVDACTKLPVLVRVHAHSPARPARPASATLGIGDLRPVALKFDKETAVNVEQVAKVGPGEEVVGPVTLTSIRSS